MSRQEVMRGAPRSGHRRVADDLVGSGAGRGDERELLGFGVEDSYRAGRGVESSAHRIGDRRKDLIVTGGSSAGPASSIAWASSVRKSLASSIARDATGPATIPGRSSQSTWDRKERRRTRLSEAGASRCRASGNSFERLAFRVQFTGRRRDF
jgi:hypothetical protein